MYPYLEFNASPSTFATIFVSTPLGKIARKYGIADIARSFDYRIFLVVPRDYQAPRRIEKFGCKGFTPLPIVIQVLNVLA